MRSCCRHWLSLVREKRTQPLSVLVRLKTIRLSFQNFFSFFLCLFVVCLRVVVCFGLFLFVLLFFLCVFWGVVCFEFFFFFFFVS